MPLTLKYNSLGQFKVGARLKHKNHLIISELNAAGYTSMNMYRLLNCSKDSAYSVILHPEKLKMAQIQSICYAINRPLGYVLNGLFFTPKNSPNWLSDDYNPAEHINKLKG